MKKNLASLLLVVGLVPLLGFTVLRDMSDRGHFVQPAPSSGSDVELANLLAYWKLDENTGTSAADSAGSFTGTLVNSPAWATGKSGSALTFTAGSSQRVSIANQPVIGNISAYTINFWVNHTNSATSGFMVYGEGNTGGANPRLFIDLNDSVAGDVGFGNLDDSGTDGFFATAGLSLNDGNWHMITCVQYTKTHRDIFTDGVFRKSREATIGTVTASVANIGVLQNNAFNNYMTGTIDQVRIYSVAITTAQINNIYNAGK